MELFKGSFTTYQFKPHFHDSYTIIFLDWGVGDYSYSHTAQIIETGGMLVLNPFDVHTGKSVANHPWQFSSMYVSKKVMQRALFSMGITDQLPLFEDNIITNNQIFQKGHKAFTNLIYDKNSISAEKLLMDFLRALIEKYGSLGEGRGTLSLNPNGNGDSSIHSTLAYVKEYIQTNYLTDLTIQQLAKMVDLPEYTLVRSFKKQYHLPPRQYLLNLRIEKAKKLLAQRYSSTEVAYLTGFFDQSHFIRHFKKFIGITPKQFASKVSS